MGPNRSFLSPATGVHMHNILRCGKAVVVRGCRQHIQSVCRSRRHLLPHATIASNLWSKWKERREHILMKMQDQCIDAMSHCMLFCAIMLHFMGWQQSSFSPGCQCLEGQHRLPQPAISWEALSPAWQKQQCNVRLRIVWAIWQHEVWYACVIHGYREECCRAVITAR